MRVKVKVKSISYKKDNETSGWTFKFKGCDSVQVCGKEYALAVELNESKKVFGVEEPIKYNIKDEKIINFISAHSKETLIIETDNTDTVVGVELVYG